MKIVIDIPKYIYDTVVEYMIVDADKDEIQKAIRNGTLLPEGNECEEKREVSHETL